MRIKIADIADTGLTLDRVEEAAGFPVLAEMQKRGECLFVEPVRVQLRAIYVAGMVEVAGRLETRVELGCSRCLKPTRSAVNASFDLTFTRALPEIEVDDDDEGRELSAEDMGLILFSGDEIDLHEAIQEQVVLALPFHPLCSTDCRGLCSQCGADLNDVQCPCGPQEINIKFAALKNFKVDR